MRIFEIMSFDPSWFFTIPGLLITGGVLLLLIALIVFVATSKKDKGANVDPTVEGSIPLVEGPDNMNNPVGSAMPSDNMGMQYTNNMPMDNVQGIGLEGNIGMNNSFNQMGGFNPNPMAQGFGINNGFNSVPVEAPTEPVIEQPQVGQVMPTPDVPVMPTNTNIEFSGVPGVTINDTVDPEMKPVIDLGSVSPNPVVDFSAPVTPSVEQNVPTENNSFMNQNAQQPVNRPIYGGANPLDNTATIPRVVNHSAYNGEPIIPNSVMNEVKVVDSTPSVNVETPAVINNQTTPISASDIFNTPAASQQPESIAEPTPIVENEQSNNGGIETLNF